MRIFDTTLRDGEQSPGATLTSKEKLDIARQLARLGVDIIEAGFPVASPDDFEAVRSIALDVGNAVDEDGYVPVICGLARTTTRRGAGPRWRGWQLRGRGPPALGPAGATGASWGHRGEALLSTTGTGGPLGGSLGKVFGFWSVYTWSSQAWWLAMQKEPSSLK